MPHPKVKIADNSGNEVAVTSNALDVNIAGGTADIDIGDVSLLLGGTAASTNAGTMDAQTLRVTLATDDTHWGTIGTAADSNGTAHGQLRYMGSKLASIHDTLTTIDVDTGNIYSAINYPLKTLGTSTYTEGSTYGNSMAAVRNDTLAALADTNNEFAPLQVNDVGALYTTGNSLQNGTLSSYNFTVMGESKVVDGSALPNTVAEGRNARLAVSRAGIAYTCLTDDVGASDLGATITTHLSEIEGAVETIEGAVSGSEMQVDIVSSATLTVDGSGVTQPVSGTVTANLGTTDNGVLDAIAASLALLDNSIASGNELQVDVVAALPAGSNAIGKLAANSGVDIGDVDVTSMPSDTFVAEGGSLGKGVLLQGDDGTDRHNLQCDSQGLLEVRLYTGSTGGITSAFKADKDSYNEAAIGISAKAKRSDALANLTNVADGDWTSLQVDAEGALYTTHGVTGMVSGVNSTISDSTAEQLDGSTDSSLDVACKRVDLMATQSNTGDIWVGDSGVTNNGAGGGMQLNPGDFYSIDVNNLNDIWVIATVDEENIHYMYFT